MNIQNLIEELEAIEDECEAEVAGEKLSGNVVKEAWARGATNGIRIAIDAIRAHVAREEVKP